MNEPFLAGASGQFATSTEQMEHKKQAIYGILPVNEKSEHEEALEQLRQQFKDGPLPDINHFIVK